jgi:hypothetical protein
MQALSYDYIIVGAYLRIEDLMKRELTAFEHFFVKIVGALTKLDFAPLPLEAGTPKKPA